MNTVTHSIKIKPSVHQRVKIWAISHSMTMSQAIEIALIHRIYHQEGWLDDKLGGK